MFYEAARSANWFVRSARSANTPADRSKRATQLSPGAALPALCLLCSGRLDYGVYETGDSVYGTVRKTCLVHQIGDSVYGDKDYDENGQERGAYFGRLGIIRRCGQEKGQYFGRLKRIDAAAKKRALILVLFGVWGFVTK